MRARDQVGELRPSQLMHTYGVGATVELPELTTLVLGLDDWPQALCETVSEPRLLAAVRATRGPQVERLRTPPTVPEGESGGVPVAPFPRWLRCPLCSLLAPIDNGLFEFRPDRWRPERTTYVHTGCPKSHTRRPPTAYPARYLMACEAGHLDDFPWVQFLHGGLPCPGTLRLRELGSGGRATDIQLSCDQCRRSRRLSQAFGEDARPFLPPRCRGRHPHLGITQRDCDQPPLTLLLGASNAWFPVGMSALSIPSREGVVAQAVEEAWGHLEGLPAPSFLEYALREVPGLARLRALAETEGADAVREAVRQRRSGTADEDPADLRGPEWRVLCDPDNAPASADFQLRPVPAPRDLAGALADVVLVERLREVSALTGFTRISAPDDAADAAAALAPLSRAEPRWLPCSEVRGEGIFLRLPETRVQEWEQAYRASGSARELSDAHRSWRVRRSLDPDQGWPGERYVLLHSLAHALIRELALECGYTASSIRERIYADAGMAGVLLYTAAPAERGASLAGAVVGARPAAVEAVSRLSSAEVSGAGIALALRVGLAARETAEAVRSRPVWTGPGTAGEQRLTAGVLHELITGARSRVLLMSYAAHTLPAVATDLEEAVARGCDVDVVFETGSDSSGEYSAHDRRPFGAVAGIRRWRWPADQRAQASVLHAKALVIDGERALIGSANLTKRALTANLEVGVLIRDPAVAVALEAHVRGLMERGVLMRDTDSPALSPNAAT